MTLARHAPHSSFLSPVTESASPPDPLAGASLAEAVIFDRDRVLLVRRRDVPVWTLPGGHRDPGETAEESCVREVREETGLEVRVVQPLVDYRRPYWLGGGRAAVYGCRMEGGKLRPGVFEAEASFWPVHALPEPILYWYPAIIRAAYPGKGGKSPAPIDAEAVSPTLRGFLRSLARTPRLWLPLLRHALMLHWTSRAAQRRAER